MPSKGKVIIPAGTKPWDHEIRTARALAEAGYVVEFIAESTRYKVSSVDAFVDAELHEFKAPIADKRSAVERSLKRGSNKCPRIVFDSRRMKYLPDTEIQKELVKQLRLSRNITAILFVNRKGWVIDIGRLL